MKKITTKTANFNNKTVISDLQPHFLTKLSKNGWDNTKNNKPANIDGDDSWYQHYDIRNVNYHFCSAIYKKDLLEIGKFDERYAYGIGYDDDDLLQRIKQKGLNIVNYNFPYVIHQNHSNIRSNHDNPLKTVDNYSLFNSIWKK